MTVLGIPTFSRERSDRRWQRADRRLSGSGCRRPRVNRVRRLAARNDGCIFHRVVPIARVCAHQSRIPPQYARVGVPRADGSAVDGRGGDVRAPRVSPQGHDRLTVPTARTPTHLLIGVVEPELPVPRLEAPCRRSCSWPQAQRCPVKVKLVLQQAPHWHAGLHATRSPACECGAWSGSNPTEPAL